MSVFRRDYLNWWLRPAFLRPWGRRSKVLFARPRVGEFGWKLLCWQGFLRKVSCGYTTTWVHCPAGREALVMDERGFDPPVEAVLAQVDRFFSRNPRPAPAGGQPQGHP